MIFRIPLVSVLCAALFGAFGQIAASAADGGSGTNLETRVFKVHSRSFVAALQNVPGLQTNWVLRNTLSPKSISSMLGVDLTAPGRSLAFKESLGLLYVKATPSELDTVEHALVPLNKDAPQIHIKSRFIKLAEADADAILKAGIAVDTKRKNTVEIMTDAKATPLLQKLKSRGGMEILGEPEAITASDRQVQMRSGDPSVNVNATLLADDHTIFLHAAASAPETLTAQAIVWDNQTLVLASNNPNADKTRLLVFITATVVDPAGNRVYSEENHSRFNPPTEIPRQDTLVTTPSP